MEQNTGSTSSFRWTNVVQDAKMFCTIKCQNDIIARNSKPLPPAKCDETLPCALLLFIGKCMAMIAQSIAEDFKVVEFHNPHPNLFRCGNTFNFEVVSLPNVL